ncbi:nicotinate phosphoribosyltransferase [Candidatus Woesearchaeota archaeon]|nr:nicotinate phosphoribosyltransferase [Candidatus Woesearchaeota archaeon]
MTSKTLLTDLYQLTMMAAYADNQKDDEATFDLFIRKLPQDWGYFIANGIEDAIDYATNIHFTDEDRAYLRSIRQGIRLFSDDFIEWLKDFRFQGDIYAVPEGTPVTANTPLLRVTGKRTQAQFLETALLNMINFQTMIATKASRVVLAAGDSKVVDFGLRRAQEEDAAMKGARAAYIGGAVATSNVLAGKEYSILVNGTHAHSFVMCFPMESELEAFRAYVKTFPHNATLLIDTYDTLQGAKNAALVAKELEARGQRLGGVRLDSGNLAEDSKAIRALFDREGLPYVRILASNDLNEYKIAELRARGARIDGYGVGTEMITAKPIAAIAGVYKLVEDGDGPKMKLSLDKQNFPGKKQVYRVRNADGHALYDLLALEGEKGEGEPLLELVVKDGKRVLPRRSLPEIRDYAWASVEKMPAAAKELRATPYELRISPGLEQLVHELKEKYHRGENHDS